MSLDESTTTASHPSRAGSLWTGHAAHLAPVLYPRGSRNEQAESTLKSTALRRFSTYLAPASGRDARIERTMFLSRPLGNRRS